MSTYVVRMSLKNRNQGWQENERKWKSDLQCILKNAHELAEDFKNIQILPLIMLLIMNDLGYGRLIKPSLQHTE